MNRILKAWNKRLDYLNDDHWRLIESSVKKTEYRTSINSIDSRQRRKSDYIFTADEDNISLVSNKAPDIMQYVSDDTIKKSRDITIFYRKE